MRTRATVVVAGLTLGFLAGCASGGHDVAAEDDPLLRAAPVVTTVAPPTTLAPSTTIAAPVVTEAPTTTAPPLPVPEAPPADRGDPGPQVGTIDIPKIGLSLPLFTGVNLATLDEGGAGLWPGTALPGQLGNAVVAAHRVSHGGPFRKIDKLVPGDQVNFTVNGVTTSYVMVANEVVLPEGIHIIEQTPAYTATLFACHPPGSTKFRYVVKLKLAGT